MESGGSTYRIYRGDTHRHTEFSFDGNNDGSLLDAYRYALDAVAFDFLAVSEHNNSSGPDLEYVNYLVQQAVDLFTLPRKFVPLYGYERSVVYPERASEHSVRDARQSDAAHLRLKSGRARQAPRCCTST